jgi:hypothetical protein
MMYRRDWPKLQTDFLYKLQAEAEETLTIKTVECDWYRALSETILSVLTKIRRKLTVCIM